MERIYVDKEKLAKVVEASGLSKAEFSRSINRSDSYIRDYFRDDKNAVKPLCTMHPRDYMLIKEIYGDIKEDVNTTIKRLLKEGCEAYDIAHRLEVPESRVRAQMSIIMPAANDNKNEDVSWPKGNAKARIDLDKIQQLVDAGYSLSEISIKIGRSRSFLSQAVTNARLHGQDTMSIGDIRAIYMFYHVDIRMEEKKEEPKVVIVKTTPAISGSDFDGDPLNFDLDRKIKEILSDGIQKDLIDKLFTDDMDRLELRIYKAVYSAVVHGIKDSFEESPRKIAENMKQLEMRNVTPEKAAKLKGLLNESPLKEAE